MASQNLFPCPDAAKLVVRPTLGGVFESDAEIKAHALTIWANRIESGDANLTAGQARALGRPVPELRAEVGEFVGRLRGLALAARAGA